MALLEKGEEADKVLDNETDPSNAAKTPALCRCNQSLNRLKVNAWLCRSAPHEISTSSAQPNNKQAFLFQVLSVSIGCFSGSVVPHESN